MKEPRGAPRKRSAARGSALGDRPPHVVRALRYVEQLGGPLVQLWGWPGTGKQAVLEGVLAAGAGGSGDPLARALALAEVETEERLQQTLADASIAAARDLVVLALPDGVASCAARLLRPGQRLLFAGPRRMMGEDFGLPLSLSVVPPDVLLLTAEESAELWKRETGRAPGKEERQALQQLTGGWYFPLLLAARARGEEGGRGLPDLEGFLRIDALTAFFHHEVLAPLPDEVREGLVRLAKGEMPDGEAANVVTELERRGWLAPPREGARATLKPECRLPAILRRFLAPEGRGGTRVIPVEVLGPRPVIRVELLGAPRVSLETAPAGDDGGEGGSQVEVRWPLRRALRILAYLASLPDLEADRDELIAAIWPEGDEETIAKNFHPTLSHLRRTLVEGWREGRGERLPDPLRRIGGRYRLNPEIDWRVDLAEFRAGLEKGRELRAAGSTEAALAAWEKALALLRGTFLQGFYDAWASDLRERYQRLQLDLLREMGDLYAEVGEWIGALDAYRRVLIEDPLRERVHVALMRVYARQGRRDLVRRQYDKLAALLAEELAVEPLPETTEEYHRLMA